MEEQKNPYKNLIKEEENKSRKETETSNILTDECITEAKFYSVIEEFEYETSDEQVDFGFQNPKEEFKKY